MSTGSGASGLRGRRRLCGRTWRLSGSRVHMRTVLRPHTQPVRVPFLPFRANPRRIHVVHTARFVAVLLASRSEFWSAAFLDQDALVDGRISSVAVVAHITVGLAADVFSVAVPLAAKSFFAKMITR